MKNRKICIGGVCFGLDINWIICAGLGVDTISISSF